MSADNYGQDDASYLAAGGYDGLKKLVDDFYQFMDKQTFATAIRAMHPDDLSESADKLTLFLCGWLGGPRLYQEKYGGLSIPGVHRHLNIDAHHRDAWLKCMQLAVDQQDYTSRFKTYLMAQLYKPAERIRQVCSQQLKF